MTDFNPLLQNLVPPNFQVGRFAPTEGGRLTIVLPGETVNAAVLKVISHNAAIVVLDSAPAMTGKGHDYRKNDLVPVRRGRAEALGVENWVAVSERELDLDAKIQRFEAKERERVVQIAAEKEAAQRQVEEAEAEAGARQVDPALEGETAPVDPSEPSSKESDDHGI
jgi:hypothetical protein